MENVENLPENYVWPHDVDTSRMDLLPSRNWDAACARSQMRHKADIGTSGRNIVSDIKSKVGRIDGECDEKSVSIDDRGK